MAKNILNRDYIYTEEELTRFKALQKEYYPLLKAMTDRLNNEIKEKGEVALDEQTKAALFPEYNRAGELAEELNRIQTEAKNRYFESFNGKLDSLIDVIKEILSNTTKEDIDKAFKPHEEGEENYFTSYFWELNTVVGLQIEAIYYYDKEGGTPLYDAIKAIKKRLQELLPQYDIEAEMQREYDIALEEEKKKQDVAYQEALRNVYNKSVFPAEPTQTDATEGAEKEEGAKAADLPTEDKAKFEIEKYNAIKPKNYSALNNPISNNYLSLQNTLTRIAADGQLTFVDTSTSIDVGRKGAPVHSLVSLSYEGELKGRLSHLQGYDNTILNTISSLYQAGNRQMSVNDIYRTMTGNSSKDAQPKAKEAIMQSIKKLGQTRIYIDASEELRQGMLKDENGEAITSGKIGDTLISYMDGYFTTETGRETYAIFLKNEPPLLRYSRLKRQFVTFPTSLLRLESISATQRNIVISEYIIKQMVQIATNHRNNPVIRYETLYNDTGIKEPKDRTEAKRDRDTVYKIIKELLQKEEIKKYKLKGYADFKEGLNITGIKLLFD